MSVHVVSWVMDHSEERLGRRLVLLALAEKANEDGTGTWPSVPTLARQTRLSERQVQNCLRGLEEAGSIVRAGVSPSGTTIWNVVLTGGAILSPPREEGVKSTTPRVSRISPEPSLEPSLTLVPPDGGTRVDEQGKRERPRNLPFDAIVAACPGTDPDVDGSMVAAALKTIRQRLASEARAEDDPRGDAARAILSEHETADRRAALLVDEIKRRSDLYRRRWPEIVLTPTALAKHWTRVLTDRPGAGGRADPDDVARMFDR